MAQALDLATTIQAMHLLGPSWWAVDGAPESQGRVIDWYYQYRDALSKLHSLESLGSNDWQALNAFLTQRGFPAKFQEFDPDRGIGAAAVLDMRVDWRLGAEETQIIGQNNYGYDGFAIPKGGVSFAYVQGGYVLTLYTTGKDLLRLFVPDKEDEVFNGVDLFGFTELIKRSKLTPVGDFEGAEIPCVHFDIEPSLDFMLGANVTGHDHIDRYVNQAFQMFKFGMNKSGARVKVGTGMSALEFGIMESMPPFRVNRPFYAWFEQPGVPFPVAPFWVGYEDFKNPGDLGNL